MLTRNPATTTSEASGSDGDTLLDCLDVVARHYGRSSARAILTAGLPLQDGLLPISSIGDAAARVGLKAIVSRARIKDLVGTELPAILFAKKTNTPFVLVGGSRKQGYQIFDPVDGTNKSITHRQLYRTYSGSCVRLIPDHELDSGRIAVQSTKKPSAWFWSAIGRYWRNYSVVILASAFINTIAVAVPIFIMHVYDRVLPNQAMTTLWVFAAGLGVAFIFDLSLKLARARLLDRVGHRVDIDIASQLFRKILSTKLSHRHATSGLLASRFQEYEAVREFFSSNTVLLFVDLCFFFIFAGVIYLIGGWIVVIPLAAFAFVICMGLILQARLTKVVRQAQAEASLRHSVLVEAATSLETIKSVRAEGYIARRWEDYARAAAESSEKLKNLSAIGLNYTAMAQQLVVVAMVIAGVYQFSAGQMSMGAIIATVLLSNRLIAPLSMIAQSFTRGRYVMLALKSLNEIMSKADEMDSGVGFVNRDVHAGKIDFRKVSFSYPDTTARVIDDFSLAISPGERVGIIGRIGSGKTTLGRLMTGLFEPDSGEILIDDVDIRQYHPHIIRQSIALMVQDPDLFFGTIRDNILMGNPAADDAAIVRAAQLSGADRFIAANQQGFEMNVGERGSRLSVGQRQCLALARVFINDPKVIFLDEPTSAMDQQTERQFIVNLKGAIRPDQTLIVSTHRNSLLQLIDRLIVIDNGRLIADGPRDKVIASLTQKRNEALRGQQQAAARD